MSAEVLDLKTFYYLYKITNTKNNKIYIGVHSTNNLDDGYMGSGLRLKRAISYWGVSNFKKEILQFFDSEYQMFQKESEIVNEEFIKRDDTYNISLGGKGGFKGNTKERSLKLSVAAQNKVVAFDTLQNKNVKLSKEEFDNNRDRYYGATKGYKNPDTSGYASVKDKNGNTMQVQVNDPRLLTGELVGVTFGCTQSKESNEKRSATLKGRDMSYIHTLHTCENCGKTMTIGNYVRWHKDNKCIKN